MPETISRFPGSGVSRDLARARRRCIRHIRYRLALRLPRESNAPIAGRVRLQFELLPAADWPAIDFAPSADDAATAAAIGRFALDGEAAAYRVHRGHLLIEAPPAAGPHRVEIDFTAGTAGLRRRPELVYTLFVPAFAHRVFPCLDQPDLKAPLELELELPPEWTAFANAPALPPAQAAESARGPRDGRVTLRFAATEPLPTYLFAFAAGRLASESLPIGGRELALAWPESAGAPPAGQAREIADLHAAALAMLERYTGIGYPFGRVGAVLIPDFDFSGMEHPGAVFYRRELLQLPPAASGAERLRRAALIAHETAHMWFGNLVTMRWFDDVWLKEVFANFMADRLIAMEFPAVDHELAFVLRHYPPARAIDRSTGSHAIRQPLENLAEAGELYDALVYHKAPIAIAALERDIGERALRRALRRYLGDYRFANADWPELEACLGRETRCDLAAFSRRWIDTAGPPPVQHRYDPAAAPAYGRLCLDAAEREQAVATLREAGAPLARAGAWLALYEDMLDGGIEPARLLTAALERLMTESNGLLCARIADDLTEIYWRFLGEAPRGIAAGAVEHALRVRLAGRRDARVWLEHLARFAATPETLAELESIWRGENTECGRLDERLSTRLALALAIRRPAHADAIIERELGRLTDPDGRERLAWLAPAVAADARVRQAKFEALRADDGPELWSVAALRLLCHPLRSQDALAYLEPGLEEAARIRRRGDIFLPRQWLDALFAGHASAESASIVAAYLGRRDHPPRLLALIRQTADPVFRAARIRGPE